MEPTSGQVQNPSLQPRNEQVVKYGEQRQLEEGVRSMPDEADCGVLKFQPVGRASKTSADASGKTSADSKLEEPRHRQCIRIDRAKRVY